MPSFPQYILESSACLLLFAGAHRWVFGRKAAFQPERRYLQAMAAVAFLAPLIPVFWMEQPAAPADGPLGMAFVEKWINGLPDFSVTLGTAILAVFFVGFMAAAFQLTDRLWAIRQFFTKNKNRPDHAFGWQGSSTVHFSQLIFNWDHLGEQQKNDWASKWLPIHPVFAWEAVLVEVLFTLNWWNPAMHWYRKRWQKLYLLDREMLHPAFFPRSKAALAAAPFLAAIAFFAFSPRRDSPAPAGVSWVDSWCSHVIFEHKKPVVRTYVLEWGRLSVPLEKYANPNGYEGSAEVELADFQQILKDEIKVSSNDGPLKPGTLSLLYRSGKTGGQAYINDIDPRHVVLKDRRQDKIYNDSIGLGDELVIFGETDDIYLSRIVIKITDPGANYEPIVNVPDINHLEAEFSFQIIARPGDRALVKIDASHPNAARIKEMYSDPAQYEIVEIPGFRTNRRYVTPTEALLSQFGAPEHHLAVGLPDVNYLPEYQGYQHQPVRLRWGPLVAAPSSWIYSPEQFDSAAQLEPVLIVGDLEFRLEAFEIIIAGKQGSPTGYRTDRLGYPPLLQKLADLQPETSIYFDRIVVRDNDGALKLFPAAFAFHIGKNLPDLDRTEHAGGDSHFFIIYGQKTEVVERDSARHARRGKARQQHW